MVAFAQDTNQRTTQTEIEEQRQYFSLDKFEADRRDHDAHHDQLRSAYFSFAASNASLKGRAAEQQAASFVQKISAVGEALIYADNTVQLFQALTRNNENLQKEYEERTKDQKNNYPTFHSSFHDLSEAGQEVKGLADAVGSGGADSKKDKLSSLKGKISDARGDIFFTAKDL